MALTREERRALTIDELIEWYRRGEAEIHEVASSYSFVEGPLVEIGWRIVDLTNSRVEWADCVGPTQRPIGSRAKQVIPPSIRWGVWERDDFTCRHCGTRRDLSIDHILAESKGGTLSPENLQTLCRPCNSRKGAH